MSERESIVELLNEINESGALPVVARLDFFAPDAPAASVNQLSGTRWIERYIDGSGVMEIPVAVWLRVPVRDTESRLDAAAALYALTDALEASDLNVRGTDTPTMESADKSGEVWRITLVLTLNR